MKNNFLSKLMFLLSALISSGVAVAQEIQIQNGAQFQVTSLETVETVINASDSETSFLTRAGLIGNKFRV